MSRRIAAKISGVAGYVPPKVLTNADLEKMVDTNDEWIRTRTGIRERHIAENGMASSHLATEAAKLLLAKTNTDPSEIDLIIVASVTPDMFFPATACLVQDRLGAKRAWGFDLSAACSGFAYALTVGAQFVGSGAHRKVMVIGSDVMSSILDYKDRATCVLFGDGAGAVLLEPAKDGEGILDFLHDVDGSGGQYLYMPIRKGRKCSSMRCGAWRSWRAAFSNATDLRATIWRWWCRIRRICASSARCRSAWVWTTPK